MSRVRTHTCSVKGRRWCDSSRLSDDILLRWCRSCDSAKRAISETAWQAGSSGDQDRRWTGWLWWETTVVGIHFTYLAVFCQNFQGVSRGSQDFFHVICWSDVFFSPFSVLLNWSWGQALIKISERTALGKPSTFLSSTLLNAGFVNPASNSILNFHPSDRPSFQVVCAAPSHAHMSTIWHPRSGFILSLECNSWENICCTCFTKTKHLSFQEASGCVTTTLFLV